MAVNNSLQSRSGGKPALPSMIPHIRTGPGVTPLWRKLSGALCSLNAYNMSFVKMVSLWAR